MSEEEDAVTLEGAAASFVALRASEAAEG